MKEFYGLSHLLSDKLADYMGYYIAGSRSTDSLLLDIIDATVDRECLDHVIEAAKEALDLRAYMMGFKDRPVFHFEHAGTVYVICNVLVDDFTKSGYPFKRPNVAWVSDFGFEQGKFIATGRLLPILVPSLIARLRIVE